jgi:hypothetical protein
VPVPLGTGSDSVNQALGQAGITVKTIAGNDVEGGQAGDVLEIRSKHTIPIEGNPKGTFVYRIGGSSTFILFGAAAPALPAVGAPSDNLPADAAPAAPPPAGSTAISGGATPTSGSTGNLGNGLSSGAGSGSGGGGGGPSGPSGAATGSGDTTGLAGPASGGGSLSAAPAIGGSTQPAVLARDLRGTTKFFYAVIGVAGAMLLASSALWRLKGVKAAWTS